MQNTTKLAKKIATEIDANVSAFWDRDLPYETFKSENRKLWDIAMKNGIVSQVTTYLNRVQEHSL